MKSIKNENKSATIADLVASSSREDADEAGFFQPQAVQDEGAVADARAARNVEIRDRLCAANMLVPGSALGPSFSDEYRRIKRPLLSNAFGKTAATVERGNLILVTSSLAGEGKTHTAMNLALSIAMEKDHTVLLVDCDVTRQGVSRLLGMEDKPGLVDVLEDDRNSIGDVILRTDVAELSLITAGKQDEYVAELLASQRMSELVIEMASRYEDRIILFDGPPLLPTPQTQILAGHAGQIVFVVEAGKTPQSVVEDALELIPEGKAAGLVLNKNEGSPGRSGYYYGYYSTEPGKDKSS